jgi:predicted nucleotidyltransferase
VDEEEAYLDELTQRLRALLGEELVGVYAGGSCALGGYEPGRSDLDVAAVVREKLASGGADRIVAAVRHESLPCPARKLELVIYRAEAARSASVDAAFELNLNTGAHEPLRVDTEVQSGEEHWFAIDRSVLAGHGVALMGPPAASVFAAPPRDALLPVLAGVLRWYRRNEPESDDAVLNAGRSLRFAAEGVWRAKPDLRAWAREQDGTNREILDRAIAELERP